MQPSVTDKFMELSVTGRGLHKFGRGGDIVFHAGLRFATG